MGIYADRPGEVLTRAYFDEGEPLRRCLLRVAVFMTPWRVLQWFDSDRICWACLAMWRMGGNVGDPWGYVETCKQEGRDGSCWCGKFHAPQGDEGVRS